MKESRRSLSKGEKTFIKTVWQYYNCFGRHNLPWRKTNDPYKILVSEVMLQQTQVARVIPKYKEFLKKFPTTEALAAAQLGDVLKVWQGLGYNRRAKFLWEAALCVSREYKGVWPSTQQELRALPGIGVYTAGAVMTFAYNQPVSLLETNVRTVYLYHFFKNKTGVNDVELLPYIARTLDREKPRIWNWALMDYGTNIKETVGNVSRLSKTYKKQSPFKTSTRYVRGAIIRTLSKNPLSMVTLQKTLSDIDPNLLALQCKVLEKEGLLVIKNKNVRLP